MTSNWLYAYLIETVRRNLCTKIHCTTCGAKEFRRGVLGALPRATGQSTRQRWDREDVIEVATALAQVAPSAAECSEFVPAVRCLLFELWSGVDFLDSEVETLLTGSWAGGMLQAMKEHSAAREAERRAWAQAEDPVNVQRQREEKKRFKQEQHEQRLALKKERDRMWREKHGNGGREEE